jgi:hypothetical protein
MQKEMDRVEFEQYSSFCLPSMIACLSTAMITTHNIWLLVNYNSPAQIRTGVKGSKGPYAWPLHSAEKEIFFLYRASGRNFNYLGHTYNLKALIILSVGSSILPRILAALFFCICVYRSSEIIFVPSLTSDLELIALLTNPDLTRYLST